MSIDRDQIKPLLILGGLVAVFILGLWMPLHVKTSRVREQIDQVCEQIGLERAGSESLEELIVRIKKLQVAIDRFDRHIPQDPQLASLLSDLSAQVEALEIVNIKMQQHNLIRGADYQVIPVTLSFQGGYESAFRFVDEIESMHRLVRINRVKFTGDGNPTAADRLLNVTTELDTFSSASEANQR